MTYVYDANTDSSEFVIFDAASMSNEPVATVQLPRVPFGFHGNWVSSSTAD
jgi:carotenoid cleavage dioxygenase